MGINLAVVGATGAVGEAFLQLFERQNFPFDSLRLLASARSVGKTLTCKGKSYQVEELTESVFAGVDLAFFSAGADRSKTFVPAAVKAGAIVIDNSSAFRLDQDVPLVVPQCNAEAILSHRGVIANPNCSTIAMVAALKPITDTFGIKRAQVSTYQAVSGSGAAALEEMERQVADYAAGKTPRHRIYPAPILFNVIPQVDVFQENGYTKEEMKMVLETRKILDMPDLPISATCVRVPVARCHSESIQIETERPVTRAEALDCFAAAPALRVIDSLEPGGYPMPLHLANTLEIYVGRVRQDLSLTNGISFWCVSDQLFKGAALNSLEIAETLIRNKTFE